MSHGRTEDMNRRASENALHSEIETWKERSRINGLIAFRYQEALEDILAHSKTPFTGEKWTNYINEVARTALHAKVSSEDT